MIRSASEAGGERALRSDYEVGRTLIGPAKELGTWAVENQQHILQARQEYDARV